MSNNNETSKETHSEALNIADVSGCFPYSKAELYKIKREWEKAEKMMQKAESAISALAQYVQYNFDKEISVSPSTDGAIITDDSGELEFFACFFGFK